ncbi:MAG: DUF1572 family protein [Acidobacteriaceae bacterium]|jgi:hypothetical protein
MALQFTTSYIEDSLAIFRQYKKVAELAMEQVTDEQLTAVLDAESNSIAIIVKHMSGNMRSRFTDFLTTDGEKPDRDRDSEFVDPPATRKALLDAWEDGWARVFRALEPLSEKDLGRTITIRGEAHSVMQAVNRQVAHYGLHVGQIVMLAKHFACERWKSLSVPKNRSREFNRQVTAGERSQR